MKRFFLLFFSSVLLLSACDSDKYRSVFVADLRGAQLNFDGEISTMMNGWLRLSHRKSDNSWELGLKLDGYNELVYDTWNCNTVFEPEENRYTFHSGAVRMIVNVSEADCVLYLYTKDDQTITVGWWPTVRDDAKKIRKGIEKYCHPIDESFSEMDACETDDQEPTTELGIVDDNEYKGMGEATDLNDVQFYVSKEESDGKVYYRGECDNVMSENLTRLYVEIISNPDPNKAADLGNILYFLDYSGQIGQNALDIMKRYNGKNTEAQFYFENGSSYTYKVSVDDDTPSEWAEMDAGLGDLYLTIFPHGTDSYSKQESRMALDCVTSLDIVKIVIGGKTINLVEDGFHTGHLFFNIFKAMAKEGGFGSEVAKDLNKEKSSSTKAPSSSAKRTSSSSAKPSISSQSAPVVKPKIITDLKEVGFLTSESREDDYAFFKAESGRVESSNMNVVYCEMNTYLYYDEGPDYRHLTYVISYAGKIGQGALDILKNYSQELVDAVFYFADGHSSPYQVAVSNYTPSDWKEKDTSLGDICIGFFPYSCPSEDRKESLAALNRVTNVDISKIVIGGKTIDFLGQGYKTSFLFSNLFNAMKEAGAFKAQTKP